MSGSDDGEEAICDPEGRYTRVRFAARVVESLLAFARSMRVACVLARFCSGSSSAILFSIILSLLHTGGFACRNAVGAGAERSTQLSRSLVRPI